MIFIFMIIKLKIIFFLKIINKILKELNYFCLISKNKCIYVYIYVLYGGWCLIDIV